LECCEGGGLGGVFVLLGQCGEGGGLCLEQPSGEVLEGVGLLFGL
jgi:hypothetical protein